MDLEYTDYENSEYGGYTSSTEQSTESYEYSSIASSSIVSSSEQSYSYTTTEIEGPPPLPPPLPDSYSYSDSSEGNSFRPPEFSAVWILQPVQKYQRPSATAWSSGEAASLLRAKCFLDPTLSVLRPGLTGVYTDPDFGTVFGLAIFKLLPQCARAHVVVDVDSDICIGGPVHDVWSGKFSTQGKFIESPLLQDGVRLAGRVWNIFGMHVVKLLAPYLSERKQRYVFDLVYFRFIAFAEVVDARAEGAETVVDWASYAVFIRDAVYGDDGYRKRVVDQGRCLARLLRKEIVEIADCVKRWERAISDHISHNRGVSLDTTGAKHHMAHFWALVDLIETSYQRDEARRRVIYYFKDHTETAVRVSCRPTQVYSDEALVPVAWERGARYRGAFTTFANSRNADRAIANAMKQLTL